MFDMKTRWFWHLNTKSTICTWIHVTKAIRSLMYSHTQLHNMVLMCRWHWNVLWNEILQWPANGSWASGQRTIWSTSSEEQGNVYAQARMGLPSEGLLQRRWVQASASRCISRTTKLCQSKPRWILYPGNFHAVAYSVHLRILFLSINTVFWDFVRETRRKRTGGPVNQ